MVLRFGGLKGLFPWNVVNEVESITAGNTIGLEAGTNAVGDVNNTDYKRNQVRESILTTGLNTASKTITITSSQVNMWDNDATTSYHQDFVGSGAAVNSEWSTDFDFRSSKTYKTILVHYKCQTGSGGLTERWKLQYSVNGTGWTDIDTFTITGNNAVTKYKMVSDLTFRYLRFYWKNENSIPNDNSSLDIYNLEVIE